MVISSYGAIVDLLQFGGVGIGVGQFGMSFLVTDVWGGGEQRGVRGKGEA